MDCEIPVEYSYLKIPVKLNFIKLQQMGFKHQSSAQVSDMLTTRPNQIHILIGEKCAIYNTLSVFTVYI